ncbi:endonuclease/exonuclease/phosphatase (EEP) superfamily protein YafD [Streptomyces sp. SLBN-118]|uniref:endonuclease/exonuclease/phosphatase family protein n=1 Tax=Streptomyces sp. SLBN-118 TaxID=2768454 RepID=UPI0011532CE1|nr:endonuclease/exonuclease/phosphatase family protein [Streptomyces sp. SLBN-118]TQK52978.1 endonuclease/exonuclease/phosphatase (EEP) superfamily protein YafD [Streptomyces sp. SLBN-118]
MNSAFSTAAPDAADASLRPSEGRHAAAWLAGLLLLAPTVAVGCRAADTDAITPVPQLLAFLPWLLLPAGAGLLLALIGRWRTGMIWAAAVLAVTGWFVRPYDTGLTDDPPGRVVARVTVLTSNIEFGNATDALLTAIRHEQPDLVFIEECDRTCSDALAARVSRSDYPYRNVVAGDSASGSAILSKLPLRAAPGINSELAMPGSVADVAGHPVNVQLAHPLPPRPGGIGDWRRDLGRVRAYASGVKDEATLVAGDFNATQDHAAFRRILDSGSLRDSATLVGADRTPSWPATVRRPLGAQIDHVLVSEDFSVRSARFLDLADTDHRALLVGLELYDVR